MYRGPFKLFYNNGPRTYLGCDNANCTSGLKMPERTHCSKKNHQVANPRHYYSMQILAYDHDEPAISGTKVTIMAYTNIVNDHIFKGLPYDADMASAWTAAQARAAISEAVKGRVFMGSFKLTANKRTGFVEFTTLKLQEMTEEDVAALQSDSAEQEEDL